MNKHSKMIRDATAEARRFDCSLGRNKRALQKFDSAADEIDRLEAERDQLIADINRAINKCAELEDEIDRLVADAQISEGVAEYHIGENTRLKRAIRDAIDGLSTEVVSGNIDNIASALREALEHFDE